MKNASRVSGLNKKRASTILLLSNKDMSFNLFRKLFEYSECRNTKTWRASTSQIHWHSSTVSGRPSDSRHPFLRQVSKTFDNLAIKGLICFWRSQITGLTFCYTWSQSLKKRSGHVLSSTIPRLYWSKTDSLLSLLSTAQRQMTQTRKTMLLLLLLPRKKRSNLKHQERNSIPMSN